MFTSRDENHSGGNELRTFEAPANLPDPPPLLDCFETKVWSSLTISCTTGKRSLTGDERDDQYHHCSQNQY